MIALRYRKLFKGCSCNAPRRRVDERVERVLEAAEELVWLFDKAKEVPKVARELARALKSLESAIVREEVSDAVPGKHA